MMCASFSDLKLVRTLMFFGMFNLWRVGLPAMVREYLLGSSLKAANNVSKPLWAEKLPINNNLFLTMVGDLVISEVSMPLPILINFDLGIPKFLLK